MEVMAPERWRYSKAGFQRVEACIAFDFRELAQVTNSF